MSNKSGGPVTVNCGCVDCGNGIWICGCPPDCDEVDDLASRGGPPWQTLGVYKGVTPVTVQVRFHQGHCQVKFVP